MLLKGDVRSNSFNELVENYCQLIISGVITDSILVIVNSANDKLKFTEGILKNDKIRCLDNLKIYTFNGLIYNTISSNWVSLEKSLPAKQHSILPNLTGMETSQFILKDILKDYKVKGYNSGKSLLQQIFRRYSLILQNNLSDEDVKGKSKILNETFADDAEKIIKTFKSKTLALKSFDYLRQMQIFKYIYQNTDYFKNIKYLFVADADELTPFAFDFFETLKLKDTFISYDFPGNSRSGFLSAEINFETRLKKISSDDIKTMKSDINEDANIIYKNITENENNILKNFNHTSLSKRAEMLDDAGTKIKAILEKNKNINISDFVIISPVIDDILKFSLKQKFPNYNIKFLSGNQKLIDNQIIKSIISIIKISLNTEINEYELRCIFIDLLNIQIKYCKNIFKTYKSKKILPENIDIVDKNDDYKKLLYVIEQIKNSSMNLSEKIYYIYQNLIDKISPYNISRLNFFLKQIQDFEKVFSQDEIIKQTQDIFIQLENSVVSENPYSVFQKEENDLIVATPQKIIDNKIFSKYQIWLDTSSNEWTKSDSGPLYNSWVFQQSWEKDKYTIEDEIYYSNLKTAKILRKLLICTDYVYSFSSLFDSQGIENFSGIESYLLTNKEKITTKSVKKLIPRDDQKPVLDYEKGPMAISAVPGAGKTTILLLLVQKLLKMTNPENIFVMTYMESAARNFKERIKNLNPNNYQLPNITTIHGLALRILKENSNYQRLGLDENFDICDDSKKMKIINLISQKLSKDELEDFTRAISVMKFNDISDNEISDMINSKKYTPQIIKFLQFYLGYQNNLKSENLIDYDDILLSSVKLLENNPDILKYYQETCKYIIEDEAQDSSAIQQKLLNLLSGKYHNIIRCGDINQAITTTFTNADVEGFKQFIETSQNVKMESSQRCTKDVWQLANKIIDFGNTINKDAFYTMYMKEVKDKNPKEKNAVSSKIFETAQEEKNFVLNKIKDLLKEKPDATVGILLRNNYQVAEWENMINNAGFKVITRSDSLAQKSIFKTIFAILTMIENPFSNSVLSKTYQTLYEQGFYNKNLTENIKNFKGDLISENSDNLSELSNFIWDMNYWLLNSSQPLSNLVLKIGLCYYKTSLEKSNVYLISTLIQRLDVNNDLSLLIKKLKELIKKPTLSGFKFFEEEDEKTKQNGKIQIMTLHKSKGDEFDYVFIPELTEKNLSLDISKIELKQSSEFIENIKSLNPEYKKKTEIELKDFNIAENLRLLYVAISRAKRKLFITVSEKSKFFNKTINNDINIFFTKLNSL